MRWLFLAVAILALLAGCGGYFSSPTPTETVTPAPTPEPATEQPSENGIAPGLGGGKVIDADQLARAHQAAIRNRSYTWHERQRASQFDGEASLGVIATLRVEHEYLYHYKLSTSSSIADTSEFTAGPARYRRDGGGTGYRYVVEESTPVTPRFGDRPMLAISRYLAIGNASVVKGQIDGERYYEVTGTTDTIPGIGQVNNYHVRALVAPSGFVRALSVSYAHVLGDTPRLVRYRFIYTDVGNTTVDPPTWVREEWTVTPSTPSE